VTRLATRGSPLALWQAEAVKAAILRVAPAERVELVIVRTQGDVVLDRSIAAIGTNVFTAEVDRALLEGHADVGVHSLKDLATRLSDGLLLLGTLERGPVEDALVAPRHSGLDALPRGARVGTGSPRRKAMLLAARPDLVCVPLRGNVETRLAKARSGELDATLLARAGLERLGLAAEITEVLPLDRFLPAAGQGLVGIVGRVGDARMAEVVRAIGAADALSCGIAERAVLRDLQAGCHAPVGALACVEAGVLTLRVRVLALDGSAEVRAGAAGPVAEAAAIGALAAAEVRARGGEAYLQ
jgi:hydroxymethylbilane synthase